MATEISALPASRLAWLLLHWLCNFALILAVAALICWASILWNGRPDQYRFTACPTAFFIAGLFLLATSAFLGTSLLAHDRWALLVRLKGALLMGAILLGFQAYGIWMLLPGRLGTTNAGFRIAIVLVGLHWICSLFVLLLLNALAAWIAQFGNSTGVRTCLGMCSVYWFGLGGLWTALLCGFALLL